MSNINWRTEPTNVEKLADDLWIVVKFQSNLEIAGSPRNIFRYSVEHKLGGGRALNVEWPHIGVLTTIKLRMPLCTSMESDYGR